MGIFENTPSATWAYSFGGASGSTSNTTSTTYYVLGNQTTTFSSYYYWPNIYQHTLETEEEKQHRLEREAEVKRQQLERNERAEKLMQEMFGPEYEIITKNNELLLDSQKYPGLRYRISENEFRRIDVLNAEGKVVDSLCVVLQTACPKWDVILTKIMLAMFDEERLHAVANHIRNLR